MFLPSLVLFPRLPLAPSHSLAPLSECIGYDRFFRPLKSSSLMRAVRALVSALGGQRTLKSSLLCCRSFVRLPLALIRSKERYRFSLSLPRCCRESWEIELATTTCTHSALSSPKWTVVLLLLRWIIIIAIIFAPSPLTLKSVGLSVGRSVGCCSFARSTPPCATMLSGTGSRNSELSFVLV